MCTVRPSLGSRLITYYPDTGTFQHSSFLAGGLVVSAGLISVRKGLIHKLSPLSGHYRYVSQYTTRAPVSLVSQFRTKIDVSKLQCIHWIYAADSDVSELSTLRERSRR